MKVIKYLIGIVIIIVSYFLSQKIAKENFTERRNQTNTLTQIVGQKLPDIFVYDKEGNPFRGHDILNDLNKNCVMVFYSFSCSTCLAQANDWISFQQEFEEVDFMGVAFDIDKKNLIQFEEKTGIHFNNWLSDDKTIKKLKLSQWPTYFRLNCKSKTVEDVYEGEESINKLIDFYESN